MVIHAARVSHHNGYFCFLFFPSPLQRKWQEPSENQAPVCPLFECQLWTYVQTQHLLMVSPREWVWFLSRTSLIHLAVFRHSIYLNSLTSMTKWNKAKTFIRSWAIPTYPVPILSGCFLRALWSLLTWDLPCLTKVAFPSPGCVDLYSSSAHFSQMICV